MRYINRSRFKNRSDIVERDKSVGRSKITIGIKIGNIKYRRDRSGNLNSLNRKIQNQSILN